MFERFVPFSSLVGSDEVGLALARNGLVRVALGRFLGRDGCWPNT
jgi:hypothetical protein